MSEEPRKQEFWTTLPGILTGVGALITAITGLILGLNQHGVLGSRQVPPGKAEPSDMAAQPIRSEVPGQPGVFTERGPGRAHPGKSAGATVLITAIDGTVTTVFADSLRQIREWDKSLHLLSGQTIRFDKIKRVEIVGVHEEDAKVRITLSDDRILEGSVGSGSSTLGFHGENDLGVFDIRMEQLKQIVFRR